MTRDEWEWMDGWMRVEVIVVLQHDRSVALWGCVCVCSFCLFCVQCYSLLENCPSMRVRGTRLFGSVAKVWSSSIRWDYSAHTGASGGIRGVNYKIGWMEWNEMIGVDEMRVGM